MSRPCGDCQVCCTLMAVDSLNKPQRTRCEHQCSKGCNTYSERPQDCRDYSCEWIHQPDWPARWRPDRLGIVFDRVQDQEFVDYARGHPWVVARETRPGAFYERRATEALATVSAQCVTYLHWWTQGDKPGVVAPAHFEHHTKPLPVVGQ